MHPANSPRALRARARGAALLAAFLFAALAACLPSAAMAQGEEDLDPDRMAGALGLSLEQRDVIRRARQTLEEQRIDVEAALKKERLHFDRALEQATVEEKDVRAMAEAIARLEGDRVRKELELRIVVASTLSVEQRARWREVLGEKKAVRQELPFYGARPPRGGRR